MGIFYSYLIFIFLIIFWICFVELKGVKIIKILLYFRRIDKELTTLAKLIGFRKTKGFMGQYSKFECNGVTYAIDKDHYVTIVGNNGFNIYVQNESNNPEIEVFSKLARSLDPLV